MGSIPPPSRVGAGGLWVEWTSETAAGAMGNIDVAVMIHRPAPSTTISIVDVIFDHMRVERRGSHRLSRRADPISGTRRSTVWPGSQDGDHRQTSDTI